MNACPHCGEVTEHDWDAWGEDPIARNIECDGVVAQLDDSNDLWVYKSPVVTTAQHCSPCAPGAGYLSREASGDVTCRTYGLPDDWWHS